MIQVFFIGLYFIGPMPFKRSLQPVGSVKDPDSAHERNKPLCLMTFVMQRPVLPSVLCVCPCACK